DRRRAIRQSAGRPGGMAQRLFEATGAFPVIVGVRGEEPLAVEIRAACQMAIDLVGRTELTTLVDLAGAAILAVGNDTGATHIAAAAGRPVIVLISAASEPRRCTPRGSQVHVLTSAGLDDLGVDRVFTHALRAVRSDAGTLDA